MKKNIFIKGASATLLSLALASCASDYLDTPHYGNLNSDDVCATTESAHQAVIGAAQGMSGIWDYSILWQFLGMGENAITTFYAEMPGSDAYWNYWYDNAPAWSIFYTMDDTMGKGNYVWDNKMWNYCYAMIGQLNEVIAGIDHAEGDAAERNFVKGEALTLRAHFYWRLLQAYAPRWDASNNGETLSVILRIDPTQEQDLPLSKMIDVLDQLYADLDKAIVAFKAAGNYTRTVTYEPNLSICYGVYARVAALKNDWATVQTMANNARQGYRSATPDDDFSGYCSYIDGEWMWCGSFSQVDNFVYSNWSTGWAANGYYARLEGGTNRINRSLYELIPENDVRRNLWFTIDKLDGIDIADFYNTKNVDPGNQDLRGLKVRRAAIAWIEEHNAPGFSGAYTAGSTVPGAGETSRDPVICDGAQLKFFCDDMIGTNKFGFPPFMRATEMYLLEAEAYAMQGNASAAQQIINEVNKKFNPTYNCTLSGQALIDEIRNYTRIELWGEGFCWFNLKRWGLNLERKAWIADDPTSGNLPAGIECNVGPDDANLWRYGIPLSETSYNSNVTYPYPGNGM